MLELKTLLSRTDIEAHAPPFLVYGLLSILPVTKKQFLPLNLSILLDADLLAPHQDSQLNFAALLSNLVAGLDAQSSFSLTVMKSRARTYLPAGSVAENASVIASAVKASHSTLGALGRESTLSAAALSEGLNLALKEGEAFATPNRINRIVLLCRRPVAFSNDNEAQPLLDFASGIRRNKTSTFAAFGIDTYAVGPQVNENLMIDLADHSGGNYRFVPQAAALQQLIKMDALRLARSCVVDATAEFRLSLGLELRRATLVGTGVAALPFVSQSDGQLTQISLKLGELEPQLMSALLVELLVPTRAPGKVRLAQVNVDSYVPFQGGINELAQFVVNYVPAAVNAQPSSDTPVAVQRAIAHCAANRMFAQAQYCLQRADGDRGLNLLKSCYRIVRDLGERELVDSLRTLLNTIEPGSVSAGEQITNITREDMRAPRALDPKLLNELRMALCDARASLRQLSLGNRQ